MSPMSLDAHEKRVADWNAAHPKGTKVAVSKDDHSVVFGETTSEAYMMGGHSAVIHVSGIKGCYSLFRVTPSPTPPAAQPDDGIERVRKAFEAFAKQHFANREHQLWHPLRRSDAHDGYYYQRVNDAWRAFSAALSALSQPDDAQADDGIERVTSHVDVPRLLLLVKTMRRDMETMRGLNASAVLSIAEIIEVAIGAPVMQFTRERAAYAADKEYRGSPDLRMAFNHGVKWVLQQMSNSDTLPSALSQPDDGYVWVKRGHLERIKSAFEIARSDCTDTVRAMALAGGQDIVSGVIAAEPGK